MARILQLIASDHRRGAETFAHQLAGELETLGHDVRVVAISGDGTGLPVEIAGRSRRDLRGLRRIVDAARWSDVVVGAGSTTLLVGAGAAKSARRPFVYRSIGDPSIWGQVPLADLRVGLPARSAARIVTVFPEATETFRRRYRVPTSRLTTITNGVPAAPFHPAVRQDTAAARARLGLAPGRRWVGLVGALSPEKDPLLALRALSRLDDEVGLVVAGGGSLDDEVRMAASELGDRVRLLGVTDDIGSVYASIDVLVLPSRTEGVPAVAIEAALCGLPVVATAVGGVPGVVVDRSTGRLLHEPDDAELAAALTDAFDHREQWGEAARRHALDRFTMDVVGRRWDELLRTVLAESRQRRTSA